MNIMHYIGFDIHKKVISFCEKQMDGTIVDQGVISATRKGITTYAIFFLKPDDYHIGPEKWHINGHIPRSSTWSRRTGPVSPD